MDFLRTLKKRRPKQPVTASVSAASPSGGKPERRVVVQEGRATKILKAG
jgi:hypothetical protein